MKRNVLSLFAGIAMAGTFVAAQAAQQPTSQPAPAPQAEEPAAAAPRQAPAPQAREAARPDVTLSGCLVQGSSPSTFILENAKSSAADSGAMASASASGREAKGLSYLVSATATSVDLKSQLNHQVSITGTADAAAMSSAPSGQAGASADRSKSEKDLPKLSAKSVIKLGDTCSAAD